MYAKNSNSDTERENIKRIFYICESRNKYSPQQWCVYKYMTLSTRFCKKIPPTQKENVMLSIWRKIPQFNVQTHAFIHKLFVGRRRAWRAVEIFHFLYFSNVNLILIFFLKRYVLICLFVHRLPKLSRDSIIINSMRRF